jgi:hypothetical protein
VIIDLTRGASGFSGKPIPTSLAGYPAVLYGLLRDFQPRIAEAVFPREFADAVRREYEEIQNRVKALQAE